MQVQPMHLGIFNLLHWRPFFLDTVVQDDLLPSGFVPDADLGHRDPRSSVCGDGEDEGLDGFFFANLCRVLFARIMDHDVFSYSFKVLYVICTVTADE
jgi:hypothetical protein